MIKYSISKPLAIGAKYSHLFCRNSKLLYSRTCSSSSSTFTTSVRYSKRFYSITNEKNKPNNNNNNNNKNGTGEKEWLKLLFTGSIAGSFGYILAQSNIFNSNSSSYNKNSNNNNNNIISTSKQKNIGESLPNNNNDKHGKSILSVDDLDGLSYNTNEEQINELIEKLKVIMDNNPDHFSVAPNDLKLHSDSDFNTHHPTEKQRPRIILFPSSTEQVSKILKLCNQYKVPVIPFSGGTSLEGHFLPTRYPTISIDISKYMDNVIKFDKTDLDVTVQAGVPWEDLNDFLLDQGLLFGCDPGPGAQIGGCVANSCSGTNAYRYGTMRENVISLTCVLPDGTIIKTKKRPKKSAAGYSLNGLITGSEGTLGIVTEVVVKCHVKPKFENVVVVSFPTIGQAAACTSEITQEGIQVNAMELLDDKMMHLINLNDATQKNDWLEKPTLFFKIGGNTPLIIKELIQEMAKISKKNGAESFEFAKDEDSITELWEARKVALWSVLDAAKRKSKNSKMWTTDVVVPISRFSKIIEDTKTEIDKAGLLYSIVGHAGDGNFHAFIVYSTEEELKKCQSVVSHMVKRALDAEGTCTGEHGVGIGKRKFLLDELGENPVALMRKIKLAIDPNRIMNPDKIFQIDPNEPEDYEHEF